MQPTKVHLLGTAEVAQALGWDRRKVSVYHGRGRLPSPYAELECGPIWLSEQVEAFKQGKPTGPPLQLYTLLLEAYEKDAASLDQILNEKRQELWRVESWLIHLRNFIGELNALRILEWLPTRADQATQGERTCSSDSLRIALAAYALNDLSRLSTTRSFVRPPQDANWRLNPESFEPRPLDNENAGINSNCEVI